MLVDETKQEKENTIFEIATCLHDTEACEI